MATVILLIVNWMLDRQLFANTSGNNLNVL